MSFEFTCHNCGSKNVKGSPEPKILHDYCGAVCLDCGVTVTDDDIKADMVKLTEKFGREGFWTFWKERVK